MKPARRFSRCAIASDRRSISLEQTLSGFGAQRRRLHVSKMRGIRYRGGYHDLEIERGELCVHPRLVAAEHGNVYDDTPVSTGSDQLDALLGGGLVPGTATLLSGRRGWARRPRRSRRWWPG